MKTRLTAYKITFYNDTVGIGSIEMQKGVTRMSALVTFLQRYLYPDVSRVKAWQAFFRNFTLVSTDPDNAEYQSGDIRISISRARQNKYKLIFPKKNRQDKCTVHNLRTEPFNPKTDVYCGRFNTRIYDRYALKVSDLDYVNGVYGNPYEMKDQSDAERDRVCAEYSAYLEKMTKDNPLNCQRLRKLRGKRLFCYCAPKRCHCNLLALWVNLDEKFELDHIGVHAWFKVSKGIFAASQQKYSHEKVEQLFTFPENTSYTAVRMSLDLWERAEFKRRRHQYLESVKAGRKAGQHDMVIATHVQFDLLTRDAVMHSLFRLSI